MLSSPKRRSFTPPRWQALSIRIKLLIPVFVSLLVAFVILSLRVPPPINALIESNVRAKFSARIGELHTPLAQFLANSQKDIGDLAKSQELDSYLTAVDKTDQVAAQSGLGSLLVTKITDGTLPYDEVRFVGSTGKQIAKASARQIGDLVSGALAPTSALVSEDIRALMDKAKAQGGAPTGILMPVRLSNPSKESGLRPEPVIEIAFPVSHDGTVAGFFIASFRVQDFLTQAFKQSGQTNQYQTVLADQNGQVIAISDPSVRSDISLFGSDAATQLAANLPLSAFNANGQDLQIVKDRLYVSLSFNQAAQQEALPANQWLLMVSDSVATVYSQANELVLTLILTLAAVFVIAAGGIVVVSQSVTRPLVELSQVADHISAGDLGAKALVQSTDEVGMVAVALNTMTARLSELIRTLEQRVQERTRNIEIAAEISRDTAQLSSLDELLQRTVNAIRQRFNLYHAQIFLADDENKYAVLVVGTGDAAEQLLAAGHKLEIGSESVVGQAVSSGHTVVTHDTQSADKPHRFNPLLPLTRSEMAVPLRIGARTIGVLDVQSDSANTFRDEDIQAFQLMADQIAVAVDNTRLFERSEDARRQADEANRQKSEFLSNMSHELRTPLNVIIGYSNSILNRPAMYDNVPLPPVYASAISSVMNSGQHLLGLITDILDLSKIEAGRIELEIVPINPQPILEGVRSTALGIIKKGVQIRTDFSANQPFILGDELRIRQILLNLVSNAAKFTEQGFITINAVSKDGEMLFTVADTGSGIPIDAQPYLFDRFRQGSVSITKKIGGTGLGLNISRQLVELHGGKIWFESVVGKGTTFSFTIPLATASQDVPLTAGIHAGTGALGNSRAQIFVQESKQSQILLQQILLVDTHSESRAQVESLLTDANYMVIAADDAKRAVTMATTLLPEVVIIRLHAEDVAEIKSLPVALRHAENMDKIEIIVLDDTGHPVHRIDPSALYTAIVNVLQTQGKAQAVHTQTGAIN